MFFFFLCSELAQVFRAVMKQHNLAPGDFPDLEPFRAKLADTNFVKFPKLKVKMLEDLDEVGPRVVVLALCCRRHRPFLCFLHRCGVQAGSVCWHHLAGLFFWLFGAVESW